MKWVEGTVIENHFWTDKLFSLKIKSEVEPFVAGQFTKIGLDINGERVGRPYSYANSPAENFLEFYIILVPDGPLTPELYKLRGGDPIFVTPRPSGLLNLNEVPAGKNLWMLATGTALGPFLSILKMPEVWQRFENIVLIHAVRTEAELSYRELINNLVAKGQRTASPPQLQYLPFVSREDTDFAIKGRIPIFIENGEIETRTGVPFSAENTQVMICGNPDMVKDTQAVLESRGFQINKRRTPGNISIENYWK